MNLNGTFTQAQLGTFSSPGSTVTLSGTLIGGLTLNASTGSWILNGGKVMGGTINESGGAELTFAHGTLMNGVVVNGLMDLAGTGTSNFVQVDGGLTVNGTIFLGNGLFTSNGVLQFGDNTHAPGALEGNATVVMGGTTAGESGLTNGWSGSGVQTLTIGPSVSIHGVFGGLFQLPGTSGNSVVIQGTVSADVAGGTIQLGDFGPVINDGTIQAINGGTIAGVGLINSPGQTITVNASTLSLSSTWSNQGTIVSTNSTLNLAGNFTRATLGNFVRTDGTVNITGTLSGGLNLDAANGSWTLDGGTINGGTVNTSGGSQLVLGNLRGTLAGVTINGNVDAAQQSAQARFTGGLVLNGTMTMGNSAALLFGGPNVAAGSLTGNGTIVLASTSTGGDTIDNDSNLTGASGTLTIGPNITIEGNTGGLANDFASGTIVNQGTLIADVAGGTISIGNGNGTFSNQGTIQANSGTFRIVGPISIDASGTLSTNWAGLLSIGGNLTGNSTAFADSNPQGLIVFNGSSTAANPQLIEVMSQDRGNTAAGFKNNFAYGTVIVATNNAELVDQSANAPGGPNALYVNSLGVGTSDTLNLNGLHVYARAVQINGSVINGTITQFPDGGPIDVNSPLPGDITPAGDQDTWTFFGRAGEAITAYVNPGTGNAPAPLFPNLNFANIQLIAPNNTVLASGNSASSGAAVSLPNVTLPTDGVYSIKIGAATGHTSNTGNYAVAVWDVTPQIQPLLLGQTTNGSIRTPYDFPQWTFTALAGEQIKFHLINETSTGLLYSLSGPNGYSGFSNLTGDSTLIDLPSNGSYTLSVQGPNGATGNYSFVVIPTTLTNVPLNGSVNGTLAGSGQAELFSISVPAVQSLTVGLDDNTNSDSNELYLRFGSPPTRETYDYRYSNADAADQSILVPRAAIGTWYALVYSANVPFPTTFSLSATGAGLQVVHSTPGALGNSAPETLSIAGTGFEPDAVATLIGPGNAQITATSTSVVSYTQLIATFPASVPAGVYSLNVSSAGNSDTLNSALTISAGGSAHLETGLTVPTVIGQDSAATLFVTYSNDGTVAMPAPLLVLGSTDPKQQPLLTLDSTKIAQGLWGSTVPPEGFSNTIQILASGQDPGVLLPGETIKIPVYFAGLRPFDLTDLSIPFQLGVVDSTDTDPVDWSSLKASLQPTDVPDAAWDQIFTNLLSQVGTTWGQFVTALDNNAAYLGSLGENVTDVDKLWGFMYSQANDALGPVEHLQTVFDASLPLPNGGTLSFWRNYHLPISGRFATGMLGNGWSVPYQSSLMIDASGDAELRTVGESTEIFLGDKRGGFFPSDDGNSLVNSGGGTYTITAPDGESDTYAANGSLMFHSDAQGNRINFAYDGSGRLISLTASTGQSITLSYNAAGLLGTLTTSEGDVITYNYDPTNQFLTSVNSVEGTTNYGYNESTDELTSIQNADGSFTNLTYDNLGRLLSLASQTTSLTLSYEEPGEISGTDALNHTSPCVLQRGGRIGEVDRRAGQSHLFHLRQRWQLWRRSETPWAITFNTSTTAAAI